MLKSDDLINKVKVYNKFLNPKTLSKAYDFAVRAHADQKRHSGDPYVIHPVAVAKILTGELNDRKNELKKKMKSTDMVSAQHYRGRWGAKRAEEEEKLEAKKRREAGSRRSWRLKLSINRDLRSDCK